MGYTTTSGGSPFSLHNVMYSVRPKLGFVVDRLPIPFCVFFVYTEVRGKAEFHIRVFEGIKNKCIYLSPDFPIGPSENPTTVY